MGLDFGILSVVAVVLCYLRLVNTRSEEELSSLEEEVAPDSDEEELLSSEEEPVSSSSLACECHANKCFTCAQLSSEGVEVFERQKTFSREK